MIGPGRYDDLCSLMRRLAKARAAIVVVFEGTHGAGFSVQGRIELLDAMPKLLRSIADQVEEDQKAMQPR